MAERTKATGDVKALEKELKLLKELNKERGALFSKLRKIRQMELKGADMANARLKIEAQLGEKMEEINDARERAAENDKAIKKDISDLSSQVNVTLSPV